MNMNLLRTAQDDSGLCARVGREQKPDGKLPAALGPQTSGITPGRETAVVLLRKHTTSVSAVGRTPPFAAVLWSLSC